MLAPLACLWVVGVQSVAQVPSPRPAGWVTDQADVLDAAAEARLDALAEALHRDRGAEVAVVTIDDSPGDPKAFATELFNTWHIGRAGADDGVLVLMVIGKRRLEIETGRGIEAALPAAWLAEMQAVQMVPAFKRKDIGGGLIAGLTAIDARLRGLPGEADVPSTPGEYRGGGTVVAPGGHAAPRDPPGRPAPTLPPPPQSPSSSPEVAPEVAPEASGASDGPLAFAVGLGALGAAGGGVLVARRRRRCPKCRARVIKLDERADDAFLNSGQRAEEVVGSVDYVVRQCMGCRFVRMAARRRWFTPYRPCPGCHARTLLPTTDVMVEATYDHGGQLRIVEACGHCGFRNTYYRDTPQRVRWTSDSSSNDSSWSPSSSDSSWSSSSDSSWSSSSDSSSSSSSSDSGFSGGSSDGGGAGSSW